MIQGIIWKHIDTKSYVDAEDIEGPPSTVQVIERHRLTGEIRVRTMAHQEDRLAGAEPREQSAEPPFGGDGDA